jgi:hypothetical protein
MTRYAYVEGSLQGKNYVRILDKREILDEYWYFWKKDMERKYGKGHEIITPDFCIDAWITKHRAWEVKEKEHEEEID